MRFHLAQGGVGDAVDAQLALAARQLQPKPAPEPKLVLRRKEPEHLRRSVAGRQRGFVGVVTHRCGHVTPVAAGEELNGRMGEWAKRRGGGLYSLPFTGSPILRFNLHPPARQEPSLRFANLRAQTSADQV